MVFGKSDTNAVDLRAVTAAAGGGFVILGANDGTDASGFRVAGAGDVNGDGLADLVVGDSHAGGTGRGYVIFGAITGAFKQTEVDQLGGRGRDRLTGTSVSDVFVGWR